MISVPPKRRGFTLMETVIAIGVLAVLLTAFLTVFGPATAGIQRAISVQEADRLSSTLEREIATLRTGQTSGSVKTGFDKAYEWIKESNAANSTTAGNIPEILFVYQYRGDPTSIRQDGTMDPYTATNGVAGKDYIVQPIVRRRSDGNLSQDLRALEGRIFAVKTTQLIFGGSSNSQMEPGTPGKITNPKGTGGSSDTADDYPEAVIAYTAEFYAVQSTAPAYLTGQGFSNARLRNPVFVRNLAARR